MSKLRPEDAGRRQEAALGGDYSEALARGIHILTVFN
jgi:hypothetical protein